MPSVIFAGTPEFAIPSLQALHEHEEFDVQLVITQPDKPVGRKQILTPPPVKHAAHQLGLPVLQPSNINTLPYTTFDVDFLVVVAYGQILKKPLLEMPHIAPINVHASLLPRWRGASPIQSALLAGDTYTGVTVQRMVEKLDAGPILSQEKVPITQEDTTQTLHDRLARVGGTLLVSTLSAPLTETPQNDTNITYCHKLSRTTGEIDPSTLLRQEVFRYVQALVPWPGVTCNIDGESIKIISVEWKSSKESIPLQCKDGELFVKNVQAAGKKPMYAAEWKRGKR